MIITLLSDIHGRIEKIERISNQLRNSDIVVLAGDITHFGREPEVREIISKIAVFQSNILAVTGNCDYPEVEHFLRKEGISLHQKSAIFGGIGFVGVGGSLPCPGKTPNEYSEEEIKELLDISFASLYSDIPTILVVHQPPFNTVVDKLPTGLHVGSLSIRNSIEIKKPIACFCGHLHEALGKDKIGDTIIINPGPFKEGNYAFVKLVDNKIENITLSSN